MWCCLFVLLLQIDWTYNDELALQLHRNHIIYFRCTYMICSYDYGKTVKKAIEHNPRFTTICKHNIQHFPANGFQRYYPQLQRGTAILQTPEQLNAYLASYGYMHCSKLNRAYARFFAQNSLQGQAIEMIDWGCGQALASCVMLDYVREHNINIDLQTINLVEPSTSALLRGKEHLEAICQQTYQPRIVLVNKRAEDTVRQDVVTSKDSTKIHLLSNVLDIPHLCLRTLANSIQQNHQGLNYFICVSPLNANRLQTFYQLFKVKESWIQQTSATVR